VRWYNTEHHHSRLRFVTPEQRHSGADVALLAQRQALYAQDALGGSGRRTVAGAGAPIAAGVADIAHICHVVAI
jgi:hypothetical protein